MMVKQPKISPRAVHLLYKLHSLSALIPIIQRKPSNCIYSSFAMIKQLKIFWQEAHLFRELYKIGLTFHNRGQHQRGDAFFHAKQLVDLKMGDKGDTIT